MTKRISVGDFHAGLYCGERFFSRRSWKFYGLFRKVKEGFSIGPILFWKEKL